MENQDVINLVAQEYHWRDPQNQVALRTPLLFLRCPSGKTIETTLMNLNPNVPQDNNLRCHYAGNMGARPGPTVRSDGSLIVDPACAPPGGSRGSGGSWGWPENTYLQKACGPRAGGSGGTAINGVIFPLSKIELGDITDGTSHTIMYAEMSWDVAPQAPWLVGSTSKDAGNAESSSHGVVFNTKVVRWGINARKSAEPEGGPDLPGVEYVPLTEESYGSNHPGGANVGMCDGSAQFIRDDVEVEAVLRRMASRKSDDVFQRSY
jgi:prepilin-type processing-associated H-X9-DG protein